MLKIIFSIIYGLMFAVNVKWAIDDFKEGKYMWFGLWLWLAICNLIYFAEMALEV